MAPLDAVLQAFAEITGRDLHEPRREAMTNIDKGFMRQERAESVAQYAARFHSVLAQCLGSLSKEVVCDHSVEGLNNPNLRAECRCPITGGYWTSLPACIEHAVTRSHVHVARYCRPFGGGSSQGKHAPAHTSVAGISGQSHKRGGTKLMNVQERRNPKQAETSNKHQRGDG